MRQSTGANLLLSARAVSDFINAMTKMRNVLTTSWLLLVLKQLKELMPQAKAQYRPH